jgi:hypothetical protein
LLADRGCGKAPAFAPVEVGGRGGRVFGRTPYLSASSRRPRTTSSRIQTDQQDVQVSWQVTAKRNDAYMREHPFQAEQAKTGGGAGQARRPAGLWEVGRGLDHEDTTDAPAARPQAPRRNGENGFTCEGRRLQSAVKGRMSGLEPGWGSRSRSRRRLRRRCQPCAEASRVDLKLPAGCWIPGKGRSTEVEAAIPRLAPESCLNLRSRDEWVACPSAGSYVHPNHHVRVLAAADRRAGGFRSAGGVKDAGLLTVTVPEFTPSHDQHVGARDRPLTRFRHFPPGLNSRREGGHHGLGLAARPAGSSSHSRTGGT